jgi:hypothetical protein
MFCLAEQHSLYVLAAASPISESKQAPNSADPLHRQRIQDGNKTFYCCICMLMTRGRPSWFSHHHIKDPHNANYTQHQFAKGNFPFGASFVLVKQRKLNFQFPECEEQISPPRILQSHFAA